MDKIDKLQGFMFCGCCIQMEINWSEANEISNIAWWFSSWFILPWFNHISSTQPAMWDVGQVQNVSIAQFAHTEMKIIVPIIEVNIRINWVIHSKNS